MDLKDIKALYRFLRNTDIVELELEDERGKVRLKRRGSGVELVEPSPLPKVATPESESSTAKELASNVKVVTSPMVGIFYRSPSPEAPSFVEMGSHVNAGQVVCIIEAMKIMNEVETDVTGKVVAVLVENGQPVEYGEPLFRVEV